MFCFNYAGGAQTCHKIVNFLSFNFAKRKFTSTTFWNIFGGTVVKIITFCSLSGALSFKNLDLVYKTFFLLFYGQAFLFYKIKLI